MLKVKEDLKMTKENGSIAAGTECYKPALLETI